MPHTATTSTSTTTNAAGSCTTYRSGVLTGPTDYCDPTQPSFKSIEHQIMAEKWDVLHALLGGTITMRSEGEKYLPKEEKESTDGYAARIARSYLVPRYRNGIRRIVAKPFSRSVTVLGTLPSTIEMIPDDVDGTGRSLTSFTSEVFRMANIYGLHHVLVDFPPMTPGATLADENEVRPKFIHVPAPAMLGWRTAVVAGTEVLTECRILECTIEPEGEFGEMAVWRIRHWTRETIQVYRWNSDSSEWNKEGEASPHTFGSIPLVTYHIERTGLMTAEPPHEDLAHLNIAHWQSNSDQRNIVHHARVPIIFMKGIKSKELEGGLTLGVAAAYSTESENGDMKYVEHTGQAIGAGHEDLAVLSDEMDSLAMQPMMPRQSGDVKATGLAINESQSQSDVQRWLRELETASLNMLSTAAKWTKSELADDVEVSIFSDFSVASNNDAEITALLKARALGDIDRETLLGEFFRRGVLDSRRSLEDITAALEEEESEAEEKQSSMFDDDDVPGESGGEGGASGADDDENEAAA